MVQQPLRLGQVGLGIGDGRCFQRRPLPVPPTDGDKEGRCQKHAGSQRRGQAAGVAPSARRVQLNSREGH